MQKADLVGGVAYALRQPTQAAGETALRRSATSDLAVAGQARIRHEMGDLDGQVEWLPTRLIVCRWTERKAFQKDEA